MHILITLLTAAAGLAWVLYRLQHCRFDPKAHNPYHWLRRRGWQKQLGTKPAHCLEDPMQSAALLVIAMAALECDLSHEHEAELTELFMREFQIPRETAIELYAASTDLLKDVLSITAEVTLLLTPSKRRYKVNQIASLLRMMRQAATAEGPATPAQLALLDTVTQDLQDQRASAHD